MKLSLIPPTIPIYGDTTYRGKSPRESTEQKDFFGRLKCNYPWLYQIAIHPKNEGERTGIQQSVDRESGALNTGASDVVIPGCPAFLCEIKRVNHMDSKHCIKKQVAYMLNAQRLGAFVCFALGADNAERALKDWLNQYPNNKLI